MFDKGCVEKGYLISRQIKTACTSPTESRLRERQSRMRHSAAFGGLVVDSTRLIVTNPILDQCSVVASPGLASVWLGTGGWEICHELVLVEACPIGIYTSHAT